AIFRIYEFAGPGQYSQSDLEALRKQVASGSGWSRIVNVKEKDESTEIYVLNRGDQMAGLLLIAAERTELTVVHVLGSIQLAELKALVKSTIQYDLNGAT